MSNSMARCYDRICSADTQKWIKWICIFLLVSVCLGVVIVIPLILVDLLGKTHIQATIKDARLNTFALTTRKSCGTTASFLSYNISVALEVLAPSRILRIKYSESLIATIVFHDQRLQNITVAKVGQRNRWAKEELYRLHLAREVQSFLLVDAAIEDFKKQDVAGLFKFELRLSGKIERSRLSMSCPLMLHRAPPGPEVVVFREVDCKPDRRDEIYF